MLLFAFVAGVPNRFAPAPLKDFVLNKHPLAIYNQGVDFKRLEGNLNF